MYFIKQTPAMMEMIKHKLPTYKERDILSVSSIRPVVITELKESNMYGSENESPINSSY